MKKTAAGLLVGFFFFAAFPAAVFADVPGVPTGSNYDASCGVAIVGSAGHLSYPVTVTVTTIGSGCVPTFNAGSAPFTVVACRINAGDCDWVYADQSISSYSADTSYVYTFSALAPGDEVGLIAPSWSSNPHGFAAGNGFWYSYSEFDAGVFLLVDAPVSSGNPVGSLIADFSGSLSTDLPILFAYVLSIAAGFYALVWLVGFIRRRFR